jgi:hypothetical protein
VPLTDDLRRVADAAIRYADAGEDLIGIVAAEPEAGQRIYLCSYGMNGERQWLALDDEGRVVERRSVVRDAASIAALCELAEEAAAGDGLDQLAAELAALRESEAPEGIEEAEEALKQLRRTIGAETLVASRARLDELGTARRRLELALGEGGSPFAEAMRAGMSSVDALTDDVEENYKRPLSQ